MHQAVVTETIDIGELLCACKDAVERACDIIRSVQASGQSLCTTFKDIKDPRSALTIADQRSQHVIVGTLRREYPGLCIIGEEDQEDVIEDDVARLKRGYVDGIDMAEEFRRVDLEEVCVFVDPVDGTLEFVEGRLENVQCLVGISVGGRAVGGVVGVPFQGEGKVVCGLVGGGVVGLEGRTERRGEGAVLGCSSKVKCEVTKRVCEVVNAEKVMGMGGAGNKILSIVKGGTDVVVLNLVTCLWDTCAPEAVLRAVGGELTDMFGSRIRYGSSARIDNRYGVIATGPSFKKVDAEKRNHAKLVSAMRQKGIANSLLAPAGLVALEGEAQATDIARDVDGEPLTVDWLSKVVGAKVYSYSAPETSAVRYLMSNACRIVLKAEPPAPQSLFYKRVVMRDLDHMQLKARTAPEKLARDVKSYQVETAFLASRACANFCAAGAYIARAYDVVQRPAPKPINSRFSLLVGDFSPRDGWSQVGLLDGTRIQAALSALANMHAYFWTSKGANEELEKVVLDTGTYWAPGRQPAKQFDEINSQWKKHRASFAAELEDAKVCGHGPVTLDNLGELLSTRAWAISKGIHGTGKNSTHPHRTLLHGDAKAANFFFRSKGNSTMDVGMIDFQWTGWGNPVVDVAYIIVSSACMSTLTRNGSAEVQLLEHYHASLVISLVKHGKAENDEEARALLPFDKLMQYYKNAFLDLSRLVFAYHWVRIGASAKVLESRGHLMPSNSYNKSVPHAIWLIDRTAQLLGQIILDEA